MQLPPREEDAEETYAWYNASVPFLFRKDEDPENKIEFKTRLGKAVRMWLFPTLCCAVNVGEIPEVEWRNENL